MISFGCGRLLTLSGFWWLEVQPWTTYFKLNVGLAIQEDSNDLWFYSEACPEVPYISFVVSG